jgi:hypothetical protein
MPGPRVTRLRALEGGLMNQGMLFWFQDHRSESDAAVAGRIR